MQNLRWGTTGNSNHFENPRHDFPVNEAFAVQFVLPHNYDFVSELFKLFCATVVLYHVSELFFVLRFDTTRRANVPPTAVYQEGYLLTEHEINGEGIFLPLSAPKYETLTLVGNLPAIQKLCHLGFSQTAEAVILPILH